MARLPQPGGDAGNWGAILNDYLKQSFTDDGNLKPNTVGAPQLKPASVTNSAIVDQTVTGNKIADATISINKLQDVGDANGIAVLDGDGKLASGQIPDYLGESTLNDTIDEATKNTIAYTKGPLGARWVFDGDSITIGSIVTVANASTQDRGKSWTTTLAGLSGGRIDMIRNAAVSGQASASILARFDTTVAPYKPDVVFATIGTNDVGTSVSFASWKANIEAYWEKTKAIGARLILGAIWPTDMTTPSGRGATVRSWNAWLYEWAQSKGIVVVPWERLADPATGGWPSGWSSDNLHPGQGSTYTSIAHFAWEYLEPLVGVSNLVSPVINGGDLLVNGLFLSETAALATPAPSSTTPSTGSGSLAAGTYQYKVTAKRYSGESAASTTVSATLAGTGNIAITLPNGVPSGNRGFRFYRKGPSDTDFLYIGYVAAGTYTFTDDGTATPGTALDASAPTGDPSNISLGNSKSHARGGGIRTDARFRGKVFRVTPIEDGSVGTTADYFAVSTGFAAGDIIEASIKISAHIIKPTPIIRITGSVSPIILMFNDQIFDGDVIVARVRFTVPVGTTQIRFGLETSGTGIANYMNGYVDYGELRLAVIPVL